jgi:hypothetical protein
MKSFEEQNKLIKDNLSNMSIQQIDHILKQFHSYNTFNGAYDEMIELMENEKANR